MVLIDLEVLFAKGDNSVVVSESTFIIVDSISDIPFNKVADDFVGVRIDASTGTMYAIYTDGTDVIFDNGVFPTLDSGETYSWAVGAGTDLGTEVMDISVQENTSSPISDTVAVTKGGTRPFLSLAYSVSGMNYSYASVFNTRLLLWCGDDGDTQTIKDITHQIDYTADGINAVDSHIIAFEADISNEINTYSARTSPGYPGDRQTFSAIALSYPMEEKTTIINKTVIDGAVETRKADESLCATVTLPTDGNTTVTESTLQLSSPDNTNFDCGLSTENSITLDWDSTSNFTYKLFRNDIVLPINEQGGNGGKQKYPDTSGLSPGDVFTYTLQVFDNSILDDNLANPVVINTAQCTTICILPGATVLTPSGKKLIDDIVAGDTVIDENGNHIKIIHNIRSGPSKRKVVRFNKGCFGFRKPDAPITITSGHPVKRMPNASEDIVENYVNNSSIRSRFMKLSHTFTLMTSHRCFIMTNGIPVCTYSEQDFEKECQKMRAAGTPLLYQLL